MTPLQEEMNRIKNSLTPEQIIKIVSKLGADHYEETETYIIFPTICHNLHSEEGSMKLYYYKENKLFHCYTQCGDSFSIFDLVERRLELDNRDFNWYVDVFYYVEQFVEGEFVEGFETTKYESIKGKYEKTERDLILPEYPKGILDIFHEYYTYEWLNDGIDKKAMKKFNILYSPSRNKVIIPHYDVNDRMIGIRGRALNPWEIENNKYMPIKIEQKWYSHPLSWNLYGLNLNKDNIKKIGVTLVVEGEKSVLQYETFCSGRNIAVACCGQNFNKAHLDLLLKNSSPKEIVIGFDYDEKKERENFDRLYELCKKYNRYCNFSFIINRDNLLKDKESPTDRGREVFEKLFERRVRVA